MDRSNACQAESYTITTRIVMAKIVMRRTFLLVLFALIIGCNNVSTRSEFDPNIIGDQLLPSTPTASMIVNPPTDVAPNPRTPLTSLSPLHNSTTLPSIGNLVGIVKPAVASISVESVTRGLFFDFTDEGAGSGIVISREGHVVTNWHVIQDVRGIRVNLPDGETYDATIVGGDVVTDLAVIKIEPAQPLTTVEFGNSDEVHVGDWAIALGNALALKGGPTVTMGIISAKGRTVRTDRGDLYDMFQTDAAINSGNSGGPLINLEGEVVGISTAMLKGAQGIGFAISSNAAVPIIKSLVEHGRVVRPLIGISGADLTPAIANRFDYSLAEGVVVTRLGLGGPAALAGLKVGDVITKLDGIPTPDMARFLTLLWSYRVGDTTKVEYSRNNKFYETTVTLVERP